MANITTRPAREADRSAVESIAAEALDALRASPSVAQWGSAMRRTFIEHWFPPLGSPDIRKMLVAERDGVVVGAGSSRGGRRHPHAFLRLGVRRDCRRQGVGDALLQTIATADPGPFAVREMLSDPGTIAFYTSRGFVTGERTLEGRIDPSHQPVGDWIDTTLARRSRIELRAGGNASVAAAVDRLYVWTHPWSPPRPLDAAEAAETYLRGARRDGVITSWSNETMTGVAVLTDSPFGGPRHVTHLALCGVVDPMQRQAAAATQRLLAAALDVARGRRWRVELEVNHGNPFLWDAASQLPGARLFSDMTLLVSRYGG